MAAAAEALSRAQLVCRTFSSGVNIPMPQACEDSFTYLLGRMAMHQQQRDGDAMVATLG